MAKTVCKSCHSTSPLTSEFLGYCADCIVNKFDSLESDLTRIHSSSRKSFDLEALPPRDARGQECDVCINRCQLKENQRGFCGARINRGGTIQSINGRDGSLSYYHDSLPTNCVGSFVCPAGTQTGYPECSTRRGPEFGYTNLSVFYHACTFNCLYCQNWNFRLMDLSMDVVSPDHLANAVQERTTCICYFGGDPTPQIEHSIETSKRLMNIKPGSVLRHCWETNGSMSWKYLEQILEIALNTGGCIKFDLKAITNELHMALCGVSNKQTLRNFEKAADWFIKRPEPPLIIASTLLVPGYIDVDEIIKVAQFIALLDTRIPYSLLGFYPHYHFRDLPTTPRKKAYTCRDAAVAQGLQYVNLGNMHLYSSTLGE